MKDKASTGVPIMVEEALGDIVERVKSKSEARRLSIQTGKEIDMDGFDLPDMDVTVSDDKTRIIEDEKKSAIRMAFLGLGQGGGNIADTFWKYGYRRVLIVNTTDQDFKDIECTNRLVIGDDVRGAGKDPAVGAKVFEDHKEDVLTAIKNAFGKDVEQVMICVGAGGGTGGGSASGAAKAIKEFLKNNGSEDAKIGFIVSMPAKPEGSVVVNNAETLLGMLRESVKLKEISPLVVADNAKILKIFPNTKLGQRWDVINRSVCGLFDSFNVLAAQSSSYATFDPQDYKKVLNSGMLIFGRSVLGVPETGTELSDAIRKNLKGGFLSERFALTAATHAASIIVANKDTLDQLDQEAYDMSFETLQRVIGSKKLVMYQGIFDNEKVKGIHYFTVAGGLG